MKYFLAIFIFLSTVSDPWIDMVRSGDMANLPEIHQIAEHGEGVNLSSAELTSHNHKDSPCNEDDCSECHTCHLGHCGILIPVNFVKIGIESEFLTVLYIEQRSSIYLDNLYRPPRV